MCRFSVYYSGSGAGSTTWTGSVWGQGCLLWRLWNVRCLPRNLLKNPYWTGVCNGNRSPQMLHFRQSRSSRSLAFGSTGLVYLDWIAIRRVVEPHTQRKVPKCAKCITFFINSVDSCAALQADCGRISCFAILCYKKDAHGTKPNGAFIAELQLCVRVDCECLIDVTSNFSA